MRAAGPRPGAGEDAGGRARAAGDAAEATLHAGWGRGDARCGGARPTKRCRPQRGLQEAASGPEAQCGPPAGPPGARRQCWGRRGPGGAVPVSAPQSAGHRALGKSGTSDWQQQGEDGGQREEGGWEAGSRKGCRGPSRVSGGLAMSTEPLPFASCSLTKRMVSTQLSSSTTRLLEGPLGRLVSRPGPCVAAPTWLRSLQGVQPPAPRPGSVSPRPPALAEPKGSGIGAVLLDMSLSATGTGENSQNLAGLSHRPAANIWNICNLS